MTDDDPDGETELEGLFGTSRFGTAEDGEFVAFKSLEHLAISDREEFRRHFESLTRLDHPNLARYLDLRIETDPVEITEEYVDGTGFLEYVRRAPDLEEIRTLQERLAEEGRSPEPEPPDPEEMEGVSEPGREGETTGTKEGEPVADPTSGDEAGGDPEDRGPDLDPGEMPEFEDSSDPGEAPRSSSPSELLSETPVPEAHSYSRAEREDEPAAVVRNPPSDHGAREIEHIDVVFLRLERLMPQILGALEYLHRFREAHGALKPTNLLVEEDGRCKVVHYGLLSDAELVQTAGRSGDARPPPEALEYARAYLAPECRANFEPTPEADLYALGCILFEAVTGCRPLSEQFGERGSAETPADHTISEELEAVERAEAGEAGALEDPRDRSGSSERRYALRASVLSELEPRCPAAWADLILRLLDSNPERRPDHDEIRRVLASSRGRSVDIPPSFVPEQESFFGRDEVVERLVDHAQSAANRTTLRATVLTGGAGYGKTALAERVGQWAARRGWVVLKGHCYDQRSPLYQGWQEVAAELGELCRRAVGELDEQAAEFRRRAAHLFPDLHPDGPPKGPFDRLDAVDAFRELLRIVSRERPVLILLDDLNSASPETLDLLADLLGEPDGLECMVISTWRTEEADESLPALLQSSPAGVDRIDVRSFNRSEAEAYIDTVADLRDELRESVLATGGSNPLLLKELVYQIHLQGPDDASTPSTLDAILEEGGEEDAEASGRTAGEKLTALIRQRLDELSRREMFVVQLLSIVSLPIPESIISFVLDREFPSGEGAGTSIRPLLDRLRTERLVREIQSRRGTRTFRLFHDLTGRLILDDIPAQHYTHLCSHLADGLGRLWPEVPGLRFEYLLRADRTSEAIDAAVRTARRAEARFAYHRAAQMWRWLGERREETSRMTSVDPRVRLARVEYLARNYSRAATLFHRIAEEMPADVPRSELKSREFQAQLASGRRRNAIAALDEALELFGDRYEGSSLLQKLAEWKNQAVAATQRWSDATEEVTHEPLGGREELRLKLYRHAIIKNDVLDSTRGEHFRAKFSAIAERSRDALLLGYDRLFLARDCHYYGVSRRPSRADEWYAETEKLFEIADDAHGLAQTAVGRARLLRSRGAFDEAERWVDEATSRLETAEPVEERDRYALAYERARIHRERGDLEAALTRADKIRHFHRGDSVARFRANQILLPVRLLRGELSRAEFLVDECSEFLDGAPACVGSVWLARQRTRMNVASGRPDVARGFLSVLEDDLRRVGLISHPFVHLMFRMSRAQALIAQLSRKDRLGEPRRGELFSQIRDDVDAVRSHSSPVSPPIEAEIQRLGARFELLRDQPELAIDHLDRAMQELARYPDPVARSMCVEARGLALHAADPEQGASMVEQSRAVYDRHGCHVPLLLEGWPVTEGISKLQADPRDV